MSNAPTGVDSIEFRELDTPEKAYRRMIQFAAACATAAELGYRVTISEFRDDGGDVRGFVANATPEDSHVVR